MPTRINLNADMGESFGKFVIGDDAAMLRVVQSASIACGFHGGDPTVMATAVAEAKAHGVSVGAHPGFNDLWGFGRRQIRMNARDLEYMVAYQIGALQAMAGLHDVPVTHVKAHGALNNMAAEDAAYADAIARGTRAVNPDLIFVAVALSELVRAGERAGLRVAVEGFADRTYTDAGMLTPRSEPDAMITDPARACDQVMRMATEQAIITKSGKVIPTPIHTLCHHGDEPTAVAVAQATRKALADTGAFEFVTLPELMA